MKNATFEGRTKKKKKKKNADRHDRAGVLKYLQEASQDKAVAEIGGKVLDKKFFFVERFLDVGQGVPQEREVPHQVTFALNTHLAKFLN